MIAVMALFYVFRDKPPEECEPVLELLKYNQEQGQLIADKPEANASDYRVWADGLADRSAKVADPSLAVEAVKLASLAGDFASVYAKMPEPPADGAEPPRELFQMQMLDTQIRDQIAELQRRCPTE
ncbi:hypothetical protein CQY22_011845 [Mycolicibacterium brumae]|uniref:Uncharacterized protein n=1 Tax=Mycolicibacterium brumae TaxID=85968 RepID=A0A2G5P939_9MYCO|nr:hypothetical protein CQY22_011845 [Mycolicibacterium brumae]RWA22267.1 hypothetical protein MBRU_13320 [Mycolicibacterium brumae DSM 44177]